MSISDNKIYTIEMHFSDVQRRFIENGAKLDEVDLQRRLEVSVRSLNLNKYSDSPSDHGAEHPRWVHSETRRYPL